MARTGKMRAHHYGERLRLTSQVTEMCSGPAVRQIWRDLYCWTPQSWVVTLCLTFSNSTFCPQSVFLFCMDLRTNSDYFPLQN